MTEEHPFAAYLRRLDKDVFGDYGEALWRHLFFQADLLYIALHAINQGGAPMVQGRTKIVLPDFSVLSPRFEVHAESKAKRSPVLYHAANDEPRHGIEKDRYEDYRDFARLTRKHCTINVFEAFTDPTRREWSGAMLLQSLALLGEPFNGFGTLKHMVFWPRARFALLGALTPEEARAVYGSRTAFLRRFKGPLWEILELAVGPPQPELPF